MEETESPKEECPREIDLSFLISQISSVSGDISETTLEKLLQDCESIPSLSWCHNSTEQSGDHPDGNKDICTSRSNPATRTLGNTETLPLSNLFENEKICTSRSNPPDHTLGNTETTDTLTSSNLFKNAIDSLSAMTNLVNEKLAVEKNSATDALPESPPLSSNPGSRRENVGSKGCWTYRTNRASLTRLDAARKNLSSLETASRLNALRRKKEKTKLVTLERASPQNTMKAAEELYGRNIAAKKQPRKPNKITPKNVTRGVTSTKAAMSLPTSDKVPDILQNRVQAGRPSQRPPSAPKKLHPLSSPRLTPPVILTRRTSDLKPQPQILDQVLSHADPKDREAKSEVVPLKLNSCCLTDESSGSDTYRMPGSSRGKMEGGLDVIPQKLPKQANNTSRDKVPRVCSAAGSSNSEERRLMTIIRSLQSDLDSVTKANQRLKSQSSARNGVSGSGRGGASGRGGIRRTIGTQTEGVSTANAETYSPTMFLLADASTKEENKCLKEIIKKLEEEIIAVNEKRISDLELLQDAHEKEVETLLKKKLILSEEFCILPSWRTC